ncbi:Vacuolar protein sorting-associated protein 13A [Serendipita sp. 399]|nr:Vacuolar protein sorting-associated protein 13A [Serendipita sp. 399]
MDDPEHFTPALSLDKRDNPTLMEPPPPVDLEQTAEPETLISSDATAASDEQQTPDTVAQLEVLLDANPPPPIQLPSSSTETVTAVNQYVNIDDQNESSNRMANLEPEESPPLTTSDPARHEEHVITHLEVDTTDKYEEHVIIHPEIDLVGDHADHATTQPDVDVAEMKPEDDITKDIPGMYRLLSLVNDGSDKIIIEQASIKNLASRLQPGSYVSQTKIDFNALDLHALSPFGIFGSRLKIIEWLQEERLIPREIATRLHGESKTAPATLFPGLYLLEAGMPKCYIIFWPEEATWTAKDYTDTGKNRVAFMRYLTKLCDQIACLASDEDVQMIAAYQAKRSALSVKSHAGRLFQYKVQKREEQTDTATADTVETVDHSLKYDPNYPAILVPGHKRCGILLTFWQNPYEEEGKRMKSVQISSNTLQRMSRQVIETGVGLSIRLDPNLHESSVQCLLHEYGLAERFPDIAHKWNSEVMVSPNPEISVELQHERRQLDQLLPQIRLGVGKVLFESIQTLAPYLVFSKEKVSLSVQKDCNDEATTTTDQDLDTEYPFTEKLQAFCSSDPDFGCDRLKEGFSCIDLEVDQSFRKAKEAWIWLDEKFGIESLSQSQCEEICKLVSNDNCEMSLEEDIRRWHSRQAISKPTLTETISKRFTRWKKKIVNALPVNPLSEEKLGDNILETDNIRFLRSLREYPASLECLTQLLQSSSLKPITNWWNETIPSMVQAFINWKMKQAQAHLELSAAKQRKVRVKQFIDNLNPLLKASCHSNECWIIHLLEPKHGGSKLLVSYTPVRIQRATQICYLYDLYKLGAGLALDRSIWYKELLHGYNIRHIRFASHDELLIVLDCGTQLLVLLERIGGRISYGNLLTIQTERCEMELCFAFDEVERLFTILGNQDGRLFYIEHRYHSRRFDPFPIEHPSEWPFSGTCRPRLAEYIPGRRTLLVVDEIGQTALLSLKTKQFRAITHTFDEVPSSVSVAPNGSCFVTTHRSTDRTDVRVFHISSFEQGMTGISLKTDGFTANQQSIVSGYPSGSALLLIGFNHENFTLSWCKVSITYKSDEFIFRASDKIEKDFEAYPPLLDCFRELWERFPLRATLERHRKRTLQVTEAKYFISTGDGSILLKGYDAILEEFIRATSKLGVDVLNSCSRHAASRPPLDPAISTFAAGDWLVGLFCLIPVHIGITESNRFICLKDGYRYMDYEQQTLGTSVEELATSISFGWYESIFNSYLASKSVGKSYALNHFADTSFAGSAMRCTQGVWLSVTPSDQELIVTMDFEGIHSIERTQQEDVLLVLFQCAISNLILFRQHTAISRALSTLFSVSGAPDPQICFVMPAQSFQHSARILDPDANPSLFQSTLAIIIRDVPDTDAEGILQEQQITGERAESLGVQRAKLLQEHLIPALAYGRLDDGLPLTIIDTNVVLSGINPSVSLQFLGLTDNESPQSSPAICQELYDDLASELSRNDDQEDQEFINSWQEKITKLVTERIDLRIRQVHAPLVVAVA